jgi:hypothetical protein
MQPNDAPGGGIALLVIAFPSRYLRTYAIKRL